MSEHRVYIDKQTPSVYQGLSKTAAELRARAADTGLSRTTLELVNIRVSQLNRCLFCLDLHTRVALEEVSQHSGSPYCRCGRKPNCSAMWSAPP